MHLTTRTLNTWSKVWQNWKERHLTPIIGDVNTLLLIINKTIRQKITKLKEDLSKQLNWHIHPMTSEYTFFSKCICDILQDRPFSGPNKSKFKNFEIVSIFSDHCGIWLDLHIGKKYLRNSHIFQN